MVDGVDLSTARLDSFRTQLGVVLQDTFLFAGTIRENVAFSRPDATADEVREACVEAGKSLLAAYWTQLRDHAQAHYVQARDVDEVIAELAQHRLAADVNRRQTSFEMSSGPAIR